MTKASSFPVVLFQGGQGVMGALHTRPSYCFCEPLPCMLSLCIWFWVLLCIFGEFVHVLCTCASAWKMDFVFCVAFECVYVFSDFSFASHHWCVRTRGAAVAFLVLNFIFNTSQMVVVGPASSFHFLCHAPALVHLRGYTVLRFGVCVWLCVMGYGRFAREPWLVMAWNAFARVWSSS